MYLFKVNARNSGPIRPFLEKDSDNFVKPEISANKDTVFNVVYCGNFSFILIFSSRMFLITKAGKYPNKLWVPTFNSFSILNLIFVLFSDFVKYFLNLILNIF